MKSDFVRSGKADLFYEEIGEGPPVLFAHAGVTDRRMWDPQFADPVPGYRYVRSDMRGYGRSEWAAEPFSVHGDLLAVIEALDLNDLCLVGCSMGGKAVMEIAVSVPERVSGLVVIGAGQPGWSPPDGGYTPPQWEGIDDVFAAKDWKKLAEIDAEVWGIGRGRSRDEVDDGLLSRIIEMDIKPVMTELERDDHSSWMDPPLAERLDEIHAPVQVVVGEHDLPDVVTGAERLADLISDHPLRVIPRSAHLPSMERPEVFSPLLEEWLGRFTAR